MIFSMLFFYFFIALLFLPMSLEDFKQREVHDFFLFLPYVTFFATFMLSFKAGILSTILGTFAFTIAFVLFKKEPVSRGGRDRRTSSLFVSFCVRIHYIRARNRFNHSHCLFLPENKRREPPAPRRLYRTCSFHRRNLFHAFQFLNKLHILKREL